MMSNPQSALPPRPQLHRRLNSTPTAMDAMKVPNLPPTMQRHHSHQRGQSADQRSPIRRHQQHTGSMVSITNVGSETIGQQILREAQQQKLARPGQRIEIPIAPQCDPFSTITQSPDTMYNTTATMNAMLQSSGNMHFAHSTFYPNDVNMQMPTDFEAMGLDLDENSQHYFRAQNSTIHDFAANMILPRTMSQSDVSLYAAQRPTTPTQQANTSRFPLTPATTPFKRNSHQFTYPRTAQSSPTRHYADDSTSMQRGRSLQGIREGPETHRSMPSPPTTVAPMSSSPFDMAVMPIPESLDSQPMPMTFDFVNATRISPRESPESALSPAPSSFHPSPEIGQMPFFDETAGETQAPHLSSNLIPILPSSQPNTGSTSPVRAALSPRRMSISDLNLEPGINASIEETNITLDDIAQFIEGPDIVDNKWICKYDDCNKRFGRKENIKSHVQTHLGDRQFRCDHCNKCFVRGHDLKRHAKIHTGTKPYNCLCGNSFARHDALTRHRQRGMCVGAFDGVVKKVIKRGRPRKHRPEMEDRLDKSVRTRKRVNERDQQYPSSASDSSLSSWGSPPAETFESLSIRGNSPFDDMTLFNDAQHQTSIESAGFPTNMFTFTPPASPGYSTGDKPSPQHRMLTPTDVADMPELSTIATPLHMPVGVAPQRFHHSPPSLSHSSSSPAADIVAFDFAEDPATTAQRMGFKLLGGDRLPTSGPGADFDSFLDYGNMGLDHGSDSFFDGL